MLMIEIGVCSCTSPTKTISPPTFVKEHIAAVNQVVVLVVRVIPYSYKFSRDVNFAFADNVWSTKINSSKIYIL